jgi:hypothetical protein
MAPEPDLSPVAVAVALVTVLLGGQFAQAIGAYSVILLGWLGGAMIGVLRMPTVPRLTLAACIVASLVVTLGVTVPLAALLADVLHTAAPATKTLDARDLLFVVAAAIPAIGHSWGSVLTRAWRWVTRQKASANRESGQ